MAVRDRGNRNAAAAVAATETSDGEGAVAVAEKPKRTPRPKVDKTAWGERNEKGDLMNPLTWAKGANIKEVAPGFSEKLHEPLTRPYFATMADYYQYRADTLLAKATIAQRQADDERSGVGKETKQKQKKLLKLKDTYAALLKELEAAGVDTSAMSSL